MLGRSDESKSRPLLIILDSMDYYNINFSFVTGFLVVASRLGFIGDLEDLLVDVSRLAGSFRKLVELVSVDQA